MMVVRSFLGGNAILLLLLLPACIGPVDRWENSLTDGYKPVYGPDQLRQISFGDPRAVRDPGKIYRYGNLLLVNERGKGIHVYDNLDPANPVPLGFLNILGNTDMAIRDNVLYADHEGSLVAIELNSFEDVVVKGKLSLTNWNLGLPPPRGFHFECVDSSRGVVVQWKKVVNENFDCYAL